MANSNTFQALYNLTGNSSVTETAAAAPGSTTTRALLGLSANSNFDGKPFKIRAVVRGVATGAANLVVNVYLNSRANTNLTTFTSDVLIIGTGSLALASGSGDTFLEALCLWNSASTSFAAMWNESSGFNNLITTPTIGKSSAAMTAQNPVSASVVTTLAQAQFFITTSISANATSVTISEFALDSI